MILIQLLLPQATNTGDPVPREQFAAVREELVNHFGGLTAYVRAPATGLWAPPDDAPAQRDDLVVYEVVVPALDRIWWRNYLNRLENIFEQDRLHVRALPMELL